MVQTFRLFLMFLPVAVHVVVVPVVQLLQVPQIDSEYGRRCTHAATSSSSSLCRMGPRPVHRPLCWERLRGILLRPGRGYASFGDECGNVLGDPNVSVRRIEASYRKRCNFPFGFASWRKGDPNVSVRRIEASFRKRCNSLSGNLWSAPGVHNVRVPAWAPLGLLSSALLFMTWQECQLGDLLVFSAVVCCS